MLNCATGAIDIGGTKIAVGIIESDGVCVWSAEFPTSSAEGPEASTRRAAELLQAGISQTGRPITAAGVGCTGPVDPATGVVGDVALLPHWNGYSLTEGLGRLLDLPVRVENDCDAAALGEFRFGAGAGARRFLYVTISTGIGTGLIVDGEIYRGTLGSHPEAGHHTVNPDGPACYCGATGCWESLCSGTAVAAEYRRQKGTSSDGSAEAVFRNALAGDEVAARCVQSFTRYLGIGLGNMLTIYAPDVIAIGGGVLASRDQFWDGAVANARDRSRLIPVERVDIKPAALGSRSPLIGAACVATPPVKSE